MALKEGAGPSRAGDRAHSEDVGDMEGLFTIVEGPSSVPDFARSIANLGDFSGDGIDDLVVAGEVGDLDHVGDRRWPTNYLLISPVDKDQGTVELREVKNISSRWWSENARWLGDVNGDGIADMMSTMATYEDLDDGRYFPDLLQVRHGGRSDYSMYQWPDYYLSFRPPDISDMDWDGFSSGGVGDINNDGYDDLCVYVRTIRLGTERRFPELHLYYGSENGLPTSPSWRANINSSEWGFIRSEYDMTILGADINGDGFSDVVFEFSNTSIDPFLRVLPGSEDGISLSRVVDFTWNGSYVGYRRTQAYVSLNADNCSDILIYEPGYQGSTYYMLFGSTDGRLNQTDAKPLHGSSRGGTVLTDIDGDGLEDMVHYHHPQSRNGGDGDVHTLTVEVHLNRAGSFSNVSDLAITVPDVVNDTYWLMYLSDSGDFDGDGFGDAAIALPWGPDGEGGAVMYLWGDRVMELLTPLRLQEGPRLYAGLGPYDFVVDALFAGSTELPKTVDITLDPSGAAVTLQCGLLFGGSYFAEVDDPHDYVDLRSGLGDIRRDEVNGTTSLHFLIVPNWTWPHEMESDVLIEYTWANGDQRNFTVKSLFSVENDLYLHGPVRAYGEWQGPVEEGGWVKTGENVTLSGPRVVYEGTIDLYPPDGTCTISVRDNDGDRSEGTVASGEPVEATIRTDEQTDLNENLSLELADMPPTAEARPGPTFRLGVDGDAPAFTNIVPDPFDWHSVSNVLVSATADDRDTSGIDASTLEYSYSTDGTEAYGPWTREGLATTPDGAQADGLVELGLPDGDDNYIRWRVRDRVGNSAHVDDLLIKVDTRNVTFSDPMPTPREWQNALALLCGITIHDMEGSGIDVSTVEYRVSPRNLSKYGSWKDWDEGDWEDARDVDARTSVDLAETPYNYLQWRAMDIAGNGYTTSPHYRIPVDVTPIKFHDFLPPGDVFQTNGTVTCWLWVSDAEPGSGVLLSTVEYRSKHGDSSYTGWTSMEMEGSSMTNRFSRDFHFPEGTENRIQFRGLDVAGNGPTLSDEHYVAVDTTAPSITIVSPDLGERQIHMVIYIEVEFSDSTSGLDTSSAECRVKAAGEGDYGEWRPVEVVLDDGGIYLGQIHLALAEGLDNLLDIRASDLAGNEASRLRIRIHVNQRPLASIASPENGTVLLEGEPLLLNATGSHDPDGDDLSYHWSIGAEHTIIEIGTGIECTVGLSPGTHTIVLQVEDEFGSLDYAAVEVVIEEVEVRTSDEVGGLPVWLIIIVILTCLGTAVAYYGKRRRELG